MQSDKRDDLRRVALGHLKSWQQAGVLHLPRASRVMPPDHEFSAQSPEPPLADATSLQNGNEDPRLEAPLEKKRMSQRAQATSLFGTEDSERSKGKLGDTLEIIKQEVSCCTRCDELARTRTQTVFGAGDPHARLCFVGEAPGADEDRLGEPFVGRGGQLLTKIIEACRMKREDVYILNMIKCRPPGNRNPLPDELANCRSYLERQFALIRPEFICCLGAVAAQNLLGTKISIGKLRGKVHSYRGAKVVCTYHPAFLLRSPSFKKETWEDMKMLMREMGVEIE
ncbi:MAG TPA: uracil-DNA glycosylase [Lacipirellulaceae bacterium]|nr:uracil-DNA glycosylase [Lacipirellulaceae bacterium]